MHAKQTNKQTYTSTRPGDQKGVGEVRDTYLRTLKKNTRLKLCTGDTMSSICLSGGVQQTRDNVVEWRCHTVLPTTMVLPSGLHTVLMFSTSVCMMCAHLPAVALPETARDNIRIKV